MIWNFNKESTSYRFFLKRLVIMEECKPWLTKNLKPGEYKLCDERYDGFYRGRINISVIVGKNGSGKSSLLELIFRMVNNVGVMMAQPYERKDVSPYLYYVMGIYADLFYDYNQRTCVLKCRGDAFGLDLGNGKKVRFGTGVVHQDISDYEDFPILK